MSSSRPGGRDAHAGSGTNKRTAQGYVIVFPRKPTIRPTRSRHPDGRQELLPHRLYFSVLTMAQTIQQAISTFDRAAAAESSKTGDEIRRVIVSKFPEDGWPSMPLERYALGQSDSAETTAAGLSSKASELGSISGGSSVKLIIYKHREKAGWYFPSTFENEQNGMGGASSQRRDDVGTRPRKALGGAPRADAVRVWGGAVA